MNESIKRELNTVTTLSKTLAMLLFVALPFVGLYIGYVFAPEKVVERVVERQVEIPVEKIVYRNPTTQDFDIVDVTDWPGEYPVLSDGNDLLILQELSGLNYLGDKQYDLGLQRIESVYYTDDFRYENGYLLNSDVVIRTSIHGSALVQDADPESFELLENNKNAMGFARDKDSLFYVGWSGVATLKGLNQNNVAFELITDSYENTYSIVKSVDSVWVPRGCMGITYVRISNEAFEDWAGPCE